MEIRNINLSDLVFSDEYQRDYSPSKERALSKVFDINAAQQLLLSRRGDGTLIVVDGRHTARAAMTNGVVSMSAKIIHDATLKQEAALFRMRNTNRANPKAIEIFLKARMIEGESTAIGIVDVCAQQGFTIVKSVSSPMQSKACSTIEDIYRRSPELLSRVLRLVRQCWPDHIRNGDSALLAGVSLLLERTDFTELQRTHIVKKLSLVPIETVLRQASAKRAFDGMHGRDAVAVVLLQHINRGCRKKLSLRKNTSSD
jgi:hypothetical protein